MKYIKYRKDFLLNKVPENRPKEINYNDSVILKEGMENDITWGGSLLGRLVNSTIRIGKILTKRVGIKKLIKNVRFELDQILYENGLSEETKKEANLIRFRLLIKEIHNVVISNDKVDSKVTQLIADGKTDKDGLLNQVIIEIEGIDESILSEKKVLLDKLKRFRDALKNTDYELVYTDEEDEEDDTKKENFEFKFFKAGLDLFKSIISLSSVVYKTKLEEEEDKGPVKVGHYYLYTNKDNKKQVVMILSLTNSVRKGNIYSLGDKLAPNTASVAFISPNGNINLGKFLNTNYDVRASSTSWSVKVDQLSPIDDKTKKTISSKFKISLDPNKNVIAKLKEKKPLAKVGSYYLHKSKDNKKQVVMILSLTNEIEKGNQKGKKLAPNTASVAFISPNGNINLGKFLNTNYDVRASSIKEVSIDQLLPIDDKTKKAVGTKFKISLAPNKNVMAKLNENVETTIRLDETDARAAWKKISSQYNKAEIKKVVGQLKDIISKSKEGPKLDKSIINEICKQIIRNESTIGKPIGFSNLIKEEAGVIPSEYTGIAKSISLLSRILMSFKDDMGLIGSMGESAKPIKAFIKAYDELKEIYPKLPTKKKTNESLYSYNDFLILEKDQDEDMVQMAWSNEFDKGEEDKWVVTDQEYDNISKKVTTESERGGNVDTKEGEDYDRIIRIVNIFGRAYRKYAVDVIPSGRPEGRISQKTFREYTYIGKGGEGKDWREDTGPGYGPWANTRTYNIWSDGITEMLEDPKYRKILANFKFRGKGVSKTGSGGEGSDEQVRGPRTGRSLLTFMNDLLAGEGNFRQVRKKIFNDYFGGLDNVKDDDKETITPDPKKPKKEDMVDDESLVFFTNISAVRMSKISYRDLVKENRQFIKIYGKDDRGKRIYLTGFLMGRDSSKSGIIFKFQNFDNAKSESIISKYLNDDLESGKYKLDENTFEYDDQPILVTLLNKDFRRGTKLNLKFSEIEEVNKISDDIKDLNITVEEVDILVKRKGDEIVPVKKEEAPDEYFKMDLKKAKINLSKLI